MFNFFFGYTKRRASNAVGKLVYNLLGLFGVLAIILALLS